MVHYFHKFMAWFLRPEFMRRFNGWAALFFAVLIIPSFIFGWLEVVTFVSVLSIWALVSSHWAAWQGAKVEEKEDIAESTRPKPRKLLHSTVKLRTRAFRKPR